MTLSDLHTAYTEAWERERKACLSGDDLGETHYARLDRVRLGMVLGFALRRLEQGYGVACFAAVNRGFELFGSGPMVTTGDAAQQNPSTPDPLDSLGQATPPREAGQ